MSSSDSIEQRVAGTLPSEQDSQDGSVPIFREIISEDVNKFNVVKKLNNGTVINRTVEHHRFITDSDDDQNTSTSNNRPSEWKECLRIVKQHNIPQQSNPHVSCPAKTGASRKSTWRANESNRTKERKASLARARSIRNSESDLQRERRLQLQRERKRKSREKHKTMTVRAERTANQGPVLDDKSYVIEEQIVEVITNKYFTHRMNESTSAEAIESTSSIEVMEVSGTGVDRGLVRVLTDHSSH